MLIDPFPSRTFLRLPVPDLFGTCAAQALLLLQNIPNFKSFSPSIILRRPFSSPLPSSPDPVLTSNERGQLAAARQTISYGHDIFFHEIVYPDAAK